MEERLSQRALVVLLSALDPSVVGTGLLPVAARLAHRHQVVLASVTDPEVTALAARRESGAAVYDAGSAARTLLERAAITEVLRRDGLEVVDALPADLAPRLADTYLALKAAGRL
ncbi:hypothetical protein GCM10025865_21970 [Paraoerskovia sediminicola]|uniref:Uncharacterized protein n=1 Tax=Paraoerskovia sediminicola TaxID=1138587 RepID=A0ABN6XD78_9CELL|nr:hypothetical protein GCM10025865_21970 [Paraoerskovia sediminicola]